VFTGFRADISRLWADLDVVVLTSRSEGLPLVLMEAMAAGRPVAATCVGGVPELIDHDRTGLLHDPGDAATLARHLLMLLAEPGRARRIGADARAAVAERFSPERLARKVRGVHAAVLGAAPPSLLRTGPLAEAGQKLRDAGTP
jgi:glycosyltransferase involved in cell wall biosynthesis